MPIVEHWCASVSCCDSAWEVAYQRFETPNEEFLKFRKRLIMLGAFAWPRGSKIVDLFCGRGSGLKALSSLDFQSLSGVDLSESLLKEYDGIADLYVGDCRELKFADQSVDIVIIQGGLHHLSMLPNDLEKALAEVRRILRLDGRFVMVEPWSTPFLRVVHALCAWTVARRFWGKLDALASMIDRERTTYEQWLERPDEILNQLRAHFTPEREVFAWGKLNFVGRPKFPGSPAVSISAESRGWRKS